jgi:hypothetical protein
MERKFKLQGKTNFRRIALCTLFLLIGIMATFGQKNTLIVKDEWWRPIVERHNIDLNFYNYKNCFTLVKPDTTFNERCIELGNSDSFKTSKVTFKDFVLITKENDSIYWIVRSKVAYHDFDENLIEMGKSTLESFNLNSKNTNPISSDTLKTMSFDIKKILMKLTD